MYKKKHKPLICLQSFVPMTVVVLVLATLDGGALLLPGMTSDAVFVLLLQTVVTVIWAWQLFQRRYLVVMMTAIVAYLFWYVAFGVHNLLTQYARDAMVDVLFSNIVLSASILLIAWGVGNAELGASEERESHSVSASSERVSGDAQGSDQRDEETKAENEPLPS